jgi:hypothetical protein
MYHSVCVCVCVCVCVLNSRTQVVKEDCVVKLQ